MPILPLRGVVVYPQTAVPLTVGQPRSIKLVDDILSGDKLVGLVASRKPELEEPGIDDLYEVGTVATVHRLLRVPDGTVRLLVQGIERFRLGDVVETEPYLKAKKYFAEGYKAVIKFKLLRPKHHEHYQFRINKKYRAQGYFRSEGFLVTEIYDHQ